VRIVREIQETLNLNDDQAEKLPDLVGELAARTMTEEVLISFTYDPRRNRVTQFSTSVPVRDAQQIMALSDAAMSLAKQLQANAAKVMEEKEDANTGTERYLAGDERPHLAHQRRDGEGPGDRRRDMQES
jgi:hypothetical protein